MSVLSLAEILETCPKNETIGNNLVKAYNILNNRGYKKVMCSISGGSDSDIVLDIVSRIRDDIDYVWFDTGVEYQATKEHLDYLEQRYNIRIERVKAIKPIPVSIKEYGQPFASKYISEMIYRLQTHGFKWQDKPYEELVEEYPNCISAIQWWCNGKGPGLNISQRKYLKEFMITYPPTFRIANKCCDYAKKKVAHDIVSKRKYDLSIVGVRKSEGGVRSIQYDSCFDDKSECANYRPIFWYKDADKKCYEEHYGIKHSRCYEEYGLARTGCVGCGFARNFEYELDVLKRYEPKLYTAACNIFKDSYEYTRKYMEYRRKRDNKGKFYQYTIFDYLE